MYARHGGARPSPAASSESETPPPPLRPVSSPPVDPGVKPGRSAGGAAETKQRSRGLVKGVAGDAGGRGRNIRSNEQESDTSHNWALGCIRSQKKQMHIHTHTHAHPLPSNHPIYPSPLGHRGSIVSQAATRTEQRAMTHGLHTHAHLPRGGVCLQGLHTGRCLPYHNLHAHGTS